uniref:Uncharacterized protein n=1 Tax=Sphaerodactylus townsendi TaxID=933632 RepID=A0ACB8GDW1_9SAUR
MLQNNASAHSAPLILRRYSCIEQVYTEDWSLGKHFSGLRSARTTEVREIISTEKKMRVFIFFIISITMASMAVFLSFVQKSRNDLFRKTRKHGITRTILEAASVTDEETYKIPER